MDERDECERLRRENLELNEQLKQLVRAERELYVARRAGERQLRQMQTLSDFAIRVSGLTSAAAILEDAMRLVTGMYPFEQALGVLAGQKGAAPAAVYALRGCEEESVTRLAAGDFAPCPASELPSEPVLLQAADARSRMPALVGWLETLFASAGGSAHDGTARPEQAWLLALPLRRGSFDALGALVLRKLTPHDTFHERLPSAEDARFLEVVGRHCAAGIVNATLLADLRASYAEIAAAQAELVDKERLAAVGEVAALLAHEVRNPLGAMFNSLSMLRRNFAEGAADAARGTEAAAARAQPPHAAAESRMLLDIVAEEAERLNRLVEDVLTFARPTKAWLQREELGPIVAGAVESARRTLAPQELEVAFELEPELPTVRLDGGMVRRALLNLLLNAAQAAPHGKVVVRASREERGGRPCVRLDVRDHGPGMDAELARHVFQPFFTTRAMGTGLGLAVVQRIAEAHGGEVLLATELGSGSTFSLILPIVEATTPPATSNAPPAPS